MNQHFPLSFQSKISEPPSHWLHVQKEANISSKCRVGHSRIILYKREIHPFDLPWSKQQSHTIIYLILPSAPGLTLLPNIFTRRLKRAYIWALELSRYFYLIFQTWKLICAPTLLCSAASIPEHKKTIIRWSFVWASHKAFSNHISLPFFSLEIQSDQDRQQQPLSFRAGIHWKFGTTP